ncbi:HtaA domain-containing protein [Paenarthrobacter aromaticivorans]|uniref:HtaA domain-containing protein n=1 Tax=Paenarthrobacter aromaticivorans TaxID=2849150 RepID=A0ABS6I9Z5_9MICC|nr:HtaA domain-containing protein [Paenarthrobacter sp. MMS21-TAE1-1]MBU8868542.1 HtaA domain-containing protein [Paenarthrobacter sp. MMS21-TAE1-1]
MNSGFLHWRVKDSFREYVRTIEDGAEQVSDGALEEDGGFVWPASPVDSPTRDATLKFCGRVEISAYRGILAVCLEDPWITFGETIQLSVVDSMSRKSDAPRVVVAYLTPGATNPAASLASMTDAKVTLARTGVRIFDDNYPAGTELAPLSYTVSAASHAA